MTVFLKMLEEETMLGYRPGKDDLRLDGRRRTWAEWWDDQTEWAADNLAGPFIAILLAACAALVIWLVWAGLTGRLDDKCPPPNSRVFDHYEWIYSGKVYTEVPVYKCILVQRGD
jgi:hypothetical protein